MEGLACISTIVGVELVFMRRVAEGHPGYSAAFGYRDNTRLLCADTRRGIAQSAGEDRGLDFGDLVTILVTIQSKSFAGPLAQW